VEELLRLGGPDTGSHGPATFIVFRNVRIADGAVTLRLQAPRPAPGDSLLEIARGGPNGRLRIRRFEHLDARLAALQVSAPHERGIRLDVSRLAVESSDPAVRIAAAAGRMRVVGDSLYLDLARLRLPTTALRAVRGVVTWPRDTLRFDLDLHADSATLGDVRFLDPRLLEVTLDPLRLAYGGGTVTGRLTASSAADSGLVAVRDLALDARDFDLEVVRPFLDTLPFAGRLSGRTRAAGPLAALALETDWTFRDSLVAGWPETRIRGRGEVGLTRAEGIRFRGFHVDAASVDLGTVRRLAPAVRLHGTLAAAGTLAGPLHDAEFTGTLEHRDGTRPPSRVRGTGRLAVVRRVARQLPRPAAARRGERAGAARGTAHRPRDAPAPALPGRRRGR